MLHVDFLNKNTFRRYPLRADVGVDSNEGFLLPDGLFCAAQFSVPGGYEKVQLRRIYVSGNYINILVSGYNEAALTHLGYFDGTIATDYTTLTFTSLEPVVYGMLMVGRKDALKAIQGFCTFSDNKALFEDSLVTYVTPPAVHHIAVHDRLLTGRINLEYSNIYQVANPAAIELDVLSKDSIRVKNDKSAQFGSCPTNPIGSMNTVLPDVDGNIDIYGIAPVKVNVTATGLRLDVPDVSKSDLCAEDKRIPPLIPISTYLKDITKATTPEWRTWPQYTTS